MHRLQRWGRVLFLTPTVAVIKTAYRLPEEFQLAKKNLIRFHKIYKRSWIAHKLPVLRRRLLSLLSAGLILIERALEALGDWLKGTAFIRYLSTWIDDLSFSRRKDRVKKATAGAMSAVVLFSGAGLMSFQQAAVINKTPEVDAITMLINSMQSKEPVGRLLPEAGLLAYPKASLGTRFLKVFAPAKVDDVNFSLAELGRDFGGVPEDVSGTRAVGLLLMRAAGFADTEWACLDSLWTRESNWRHKAENKSSGAYGIPQALPGTKMNSAGSDWRENPVTQIRWGLTYIKSRYGSPCRAWAFWMQESGGDGHGGWY